MEKERREARDREWGDGIFREMNEWMKETGNQLVRQRERGHKASVQMDSVLARRATRLHVMNGKRTCQPIPCGKKLSPVHDHQLQTSI